MDACECIEYYGDHKNKSGEPDELDDKERLGLVETAFKQLKADYDEVSTLLKRFYGVASELVYCNKDHSTKWLTLL
jgi:hypothetical protein